MYGFFPPIWISLYFFSIFPPFEKPPGANFFKSHSKIRTSTLPYWILCRFCEILQELTICSPLRELIPRGVDH